MTDTTASALTVARLDHAGRRSHDVYTAGFYADGWDHEVRTLLGYSGAGGADVGEILATIARMSPGDDEAWFAGWHALGQRIFEIGAEAAQNGHRVSAAGAYLRAANYLATAADSVRATGSDADRLTVFRLHRAAWEGFVSQAGWCVERVDIPYEQSSMPGWLFQPDATGTARPTLVMNNGSDASISGLWCVGAGAALARGYNVLVFDGPGQQSMLLERGVPFRPDWEAVLTPIADFLLARDDVDSAQLAVYGYSQAGYWVPRALAFEHRFACAVVDGGIVDVRRAWYDSIPKLILREYLNGQRHAFDQTMSLTMRLPGAQRSRTGWNFRARPYGVTGDYADVLDELGRYALSRETAAFIRTPLLITDPDGDGFFPQSADLAAIVPGAELVRFTQDEGAAGHCQPLARELTSQRIFDWLDDRLRP